MKTIQYVSTIYYYDGPQVIEACDDSGGHYVAVMVEPTSSHDRFLVARVAPEGLRGFRGGMLDLRSLMLEQGTRNWFLAEADGGLDRPMTLVEQTDSLLESGLLPDSGFVLHDGAVASSVLSDAGAYNKLALVVTPPEAAEEHQG